jgi:hypothetical protein
MVSSRKAAHNIGVCIFVAWAAGNLQGCFNNVDTSDPNHCKGYDFRLLTQSVYGDVRISVETGNEANASVLPREIFYANFVFKVDTENLSLYTKVDIPLANVSAVGVIIFGEDTDVTLISTSSSQQCVTSDIGDPWGVVVALIKSIEDYWNKNSTCEISGDDAVFAKHTDISFGPFGNISLDLGFEVNRASMHFCSAQMHSKVRSNVRRFKVFDSSNIDVAITVKNSTSAGPTFSDLDYKSWGIPCTPTPPLLPPGQPEHVPDILDLLPPGLDSLGGAMRLALNSRGIPGLMERFTSRHTSQYGATITPVTV